MKNNLYFLIGILAAVFSIDSASAQDQRQYQELEYFQDDASYLSVLYRGKQATVYRIPANGHIYWNSPEFQVGDIVFEDKYYQGVNLNFDSVAQEVLAIAPENTVPVALDVDKVSSFSMGDTRFVNVKELGIDLPDVIYEVIAQGEKVSLYKNVKKDLRFNAQEVNGKTIGYDDPLYRYDEKSYYEYMPSYYVVKAGQKPIKIKNNWSLRRSLREYRKEIRECVSEYENRMSGVYLDEYAQIIIDYINQ